MSLSQLNQHDRESFLEALARGRYHLLLGAGASIGATGGDGQPLPTAGELARELLRAFQLGDDTASLYDAYEAAHGRVTAEGLDRDHYLKQRFSNCTPSWQTILARFRWRRLWTLNIDDLVERVYHLESGGQRLRPFNWSSPFKDPELEDDELQIVHLHGYGPWIGNPEFPLVFSIAQYMEAVSASHAWHRIFGDQFTQEPFLIVGASLAIEWDLAEALNRGSASFRPSVAILSSVNTLARQRLERWNIRVIEAEAHTVFDEIGSEIGTYESEFAKRAPPGGLTTRTRIFLDQFQWLRPDSPLRSPPTHDFYRGDDPTWPDIVAGLDAPFDVTRAQIATLPDAQSKRIGQRKPSVVCLWGPPGPGKSTALLRIGMDAAVKGFDVYLFRGNQALDVEATHEFLRSAPPSVLLFDSLADVSLEVAELAAVCTKRKTQLLVYGAERSRRTVWLKRTIPPAVLKLDDQSKLDRLSERDVDVLIDKLDHQGRLGILADRSPQDRREYFVRRGRQQLLPAMYELSHGAGFQQRIISEYRNDITTLAIRDLYALVCIAYQFGYPLPIGIASVASGVSVRDLLAALAEGGQLHDAIRRVESNLAARHRVIASVIASEALSVGDRMRLSRALGRAMSPHVTIDAMRHQTIHFRIIRNLMDATFLSDWLGAVNAPRWYEDLLEEYGWNSRYWEQRALAETNLKSPNFAKARSFAEKAVGIEQHSFGYTTLGMILLRMAREAFPIGSVQAEEALWEGIDNLGRARELARFPNERPFEDFFVNVVAFCEDVLRAGGAISSRTSREWNEWMRAATALQGPGLAAFHEQLPGLQARWLMLATMPTST